MKIKERQKEFMRMTPETLEASLKEKKEHQRALKFNLQAGKIKNVREIREIRRDIARIKTILCQKNN